MTKRGVGPACRPYLSATRHAGPAGASCTAFDPSSYIRRRGCFFLCQGRHSRGSTTASCTSRPPRTRTTARVLDGEHGRLAVPLWQQRARGAAQRSTCTRPRSTVLIITARVDTARGLLESEWRSHGGLLPKKKFSLPQTTKTLFLRRAVERLPTLLRAPRSPRATLHTLVRCSCTCCAAPCHSR